MATALGLVLASQVAAIAAPTESVAGWAKNAMPVGEAASNKTVTVALYLSFKDLDGLKALVKAQSTPGNKQYGKYLTPEEFRARFAPDVADVQLVQNTLKEMGFKVEYTPKSGLFVEASGTVAQIKSAFKVSQRLYAVNGKQLRANLENPTLPAKLSKIVTYVAGLDDMAQLRTPLHVKAHGASDVVDAAKPFAATSPRVSPNAPPPPTDGDPGRFCSTYWGDNNATLAKAPGLFPKTLPWEMCGYTPQQLRQAYGSDNVAQDGTGVRVAIVDVYGSPTILHDANQYSTNHGLPLLTYLDFVQIVPPGIYNVPASDPCGPQGWYEEESLDVEAVHSMAPGAFILFAGIACTDPTNHALYNLIDNHLADIVTNSYSYNGEALPADFITSENLYFLQAAAEGMSILFSTGDSGDLAAINGIASGSWDATSPYVTGVGATSLALYNNTGSKSEWGWGDYRAFLANANVHPDGKSIHMTGVELPFSFYAGSGGGPSLTQLQPDYQGNIPYSLNGYTTLENGSLVPLEAPRRTDPDIAMVGDPYTGFLYGETYTISGNAVYDSPCKPIGKTGTEYCEEVIGGTSLSSPLFAGVLALVDQARFAAGKTAVGFVNPALYSLPVGAAGTTTSPISDVAPPATPTALLRGYLASSTKVRLVAMNATTSANGKSVFEGADTSYTTTTGYDLVTGLGTPNVPALIQAFSLLP
jgi:subtilase family serine protease